ncbi:UNKNOWN [Stylonychia lemnae]|uniref:Serine aminopeptidase S33 domain-containing protein n=1 Tax=Stylonychia lemnae TaxID=5949 RepID=A0A078B7Y5_STYLE|nr:UNKNOWN [Stylonychia lemnae]|eukprot:CDW90331.1 UNKNOWN [Stylonychia lemnae]
MEESLKQEKSKNLNFYAQEWTSKDFIKLVSVHDQKSKLKTYQQIRDEKYLGKPPKGIIVFFHGLGSHIQRYIYMAKVFAENGYDCVGYDSLGFGKSEGERGAINSFDNYCEDGYQFTIACRKLYQEQHPEKTIPFFAFGYSMGSKVSIRCQKIHKDRQNSDLFQAFLWHAPAFGRKLKLPDYLKWLDEISQFEPTKLVTPTKSLPPNENYMFLAVPHADPVSFLGPWQAKTQQQFMNIPQDIQDFSKETDIPISCAFASIDSAVDNSDALIWISQVKTPKSKVEIRSYFSEHVFLYNGQVYEEVINDDIVFLERILKN